MLRRLLALYIGRELSLVYGDKAVLVGSALDPAKSKRPNYMPGIMINTLWGEMAAQLTESAGNPKLYDYVNESDKKGVSPSSEMLKRHRRCIRYLRTAGHCGCRTLDLRDDVG